nr:capsid protein [Cressdnaviricota sp.]
MYGRKRRFGQLLRREFPEYNKRYLKYIRTGAGRHGVRRIGHYIGKSEAAVRRVRPAALLRTGGLPAYPSNIERKFQDTTDVTDITSTATVILCNGLAQGTGINQRIGVRVLVKSIQLKINMVRENAATTTLQQVHHTLVYDRQTNGAAPTYADVWGGNTFPGTDLRNVANTGRFFVIWDNVENIEGVNMGGSSSKFVQFYRKVNLPVYYNAGNAGTVADIATGGIFLIAKGSTAAGADDVDTTTSIRLRYTDM